MNKSELWYECRYVSGFAEESWQEIPAVSLCEVKTGENGRLSTIVRSCWDFNYLYFRFTCEDDFIVANMTERDDPIFKEDVVEVFIDETATGRRYMEFEVSPNNVVFDAMIENDLCGSYKVDSKWNAEGLMTSVRCEEVTLEYEIAIPLGVFAAQPKKGDIWRINFYRIDQTREGIRNYDAWSPTGEVNFHIPQAFGYMRFN